MAQLKFDKNLSLVEEVPHWKDENDIPLNIRESMIGKAEDFVIYDCETSTVRCPKCLTVLEENRRCPNCNKSYDNLENYSVFDNGDFYGDVIYFDSISEDGWREDEERWLLFDAKDGSVVLYLIGFNSTFYLNHYDKRVKRNFTFEVHEAIHVRKDGMTDLETGESVSFHQFLNIIIDADDGGIPNKWSDLNDGIYKLYTGNLDILKDTIYKYSSIWQAKKAFDGIHNSFFKSITYDAIRVPQFEYLMKLGLYSLALSNPAQYVGKNFKERFGVDKRLLSWMRKRNVTEHELNLIRKLKIESDEVLDFILCVGYRDELLEYFVTEGKLKIEKLKQYFDEHKLDYDHLTEYCDYLEFAQDAGYDMEDRGVLYPKDLMDAHNKLYVESRIKEDPTIKEDIEKRARELEINRWEIGEFIIYPAPSLESLVDESAQQANCVRTYASAYANKETDIYFLRRKSEIEKSFVTVEVNNGQIVQARVKYNELPPKEIKDILEKWENTLTKRKKVD